MEIPWEKLDPDTLTRVIEEFVTREGTDYGNAELTLAQKVQQIHAALRQKRAVLVYDNETESCHILPKS